MSRTFEDIIYSVVRRGIRDELPPHLWPVTPPRAPQRAPQRAPPRAPVHTVNFYSDDDEDSTYSPSDEEEEDENELTIESLMIQLDNSGNKAQTFSRILRDNFAWPNKEINRAYNLVNGSQYNINHNTSSAEVTPSWWTILRGNDYDKTRKARKIFEYMIAQQQ